jgi:putative thiamine transport system ATP-binding protein
MLHIENLTLRRAGQPLFEKLDLRIAPGEVLTLMGASGSGKSTVLNWMIGALDPVFSASGALWLNGQRVDGTPTERRRIGILFQDDLLFANMSVGQNLAFALPASIKGVARRERISQVLTDVGLAGFAERDPATLSGGQRARISLMRALLAQPHALLLDEPFSKLDVVLRGQFRAWVFAHLQRVGIATLLVTHDPQDAPADGRVLDICNWQKT